jgi:hypothetical protein
LQVILRISFARLPKCVVKEFSQILIPHHLEQRGLRQQKNKNRDYFFVYCYCLLPLNEHFSQSSFRKEKTTILKDENFHHPFFIEFVKKKMVYL